MARHWSEWYGCSCGFRTLSYAKDARHRHNFPLLCRRVKRSKDNGGDAGTNERAAAGAGGVGQVEHGAASKSDTQAGAGPQAGMAP